MLAMAAGGLGVRRLDALFEGRLVRAAATADPVAVVPVTREVRARNIALVKLEGAETGDLQLAAARAVRAHLGGGTLAWALDDTLPIAMYRQVPPVVEGAVLGGYDPGRWKSSAPEPGVDRFVVCGADEDEEQAARPREARRAHRALDERRARARRRAAQLRDARGPGRARRRASRRQRRGHRSDRRRAHRAGGGGRVERAGAEAHRPALRARRRPRAAAAGVRGQGRHVRRRRLLPQAAVGHRAPEGRHGRRGGGARGARRHRRARAAAQRDRGHPRLREHARAPTRSGRRM